MAPQEIPDPPRSSGMEGSGRRTRFAGAVVVLGLGLCSLLLLMVFSPWF